MTDTSPETVVPGRRRRWPWVLLGLVICLGLGIAWVVHRVQQVRPFYRQALQLDQPTLESGRREVLHRVSRFQNALRRVGQWELRLTDEQINGWLAVDLAKNHPTALPAEYSNPRVQIQAEQISLGVMYQTRQFPALLSLDLQVARIDEQRLSIRLTKARIGELPWSATHIVEILSDVLREQGYLVQVNSLDNDPVLVLTIPPQEGKFGRLVLERIEHRAGELLIQGSTQLVP